LVGELVTRRFGVVLHIATVARLLDRLGITPQKPTRQAFQRDPVECVRWMTAEFPRIVREARRRQAVLVFLDETGSGGPAGGRTWGERGGAVVVRVTDAPPDQLHLGHHPRGSSGSGAFGQPTPPPTSTFSALPDHSQAPSSSSTTGTPPDGGGHRAASSRPRASASRVHFPAMPRPEPDEHVDHLKQIFRQDPLALDERIETRVEHTMTTLQRDRAAVRKFFGHPAVAYIRKALHWK
jgi:hypothetical protein